MDLKRIWEKMNVKAPGKNQILILFLCGVLLMVITIPVKEKEITEENSELIREGTLNSTEYVTYLENQLGVLLVGNILM